MSVVDETGHTQDDWHLSFACDILTQDHILRALIHQLKIDHRLVFAWQFSALRAFLPVPARLPSEKEPRGYPGRDKEPMPPGMLDSILEALTRDRDIRRLIAAHLKRTRGLDTHAVMKQMLNWKDEYDARPKPEHVDPLAHVEKVRQADTLEEAASIRAARDEKRGQATILLTDD